MTLLALQRTFGNRAVVRMLQRRKGTRTGRSPLPTPSARRSTSSGGRGTRRAGSRTRRPGSEVVRRKLEQAYRVGRRAAGGASELNADAWKKMVDALTSAHQEAETAGSLTDVRIAQDPTNAGERYIKAGVTHDPTGVDVPPATPAAQAAPVAATGSRARRRRATGPEAPATGTPSHGSSMRLRTAAPEGPSADAFTRDELVALGG
jgi:hypothetical protein